MPGPAPTGQHAGPFPLSPTTAWLRSPGVDIVRVGGAWPPIAEWVSITGLGRCVACAGASAGRALRSGAMGGTSIKPTRSTACCNEPRVVGNGLEVPTDRRYRQTATTRACSRQPTGRPGWSRSWWTRGGWSSCAAHRRPRECCEACSTISPAVPASHKMAMSAQKGARGDQTVAAQPRRQPRGAVKRIGSRSGEICLVWDDEGP